MFKHYIKIILRNMFRNKTYSLINILGLSVGMAASILILHYVNFEKSYDEFHNDSNRIYRLRYERTDIKGDAVRFASCCPPAAARIRGKYPEVKTIGRMLHFNASVSYENNKFPEERMFYAESEIFEILKFNFNSGGPTSGIKGPNTAFISKSIAEKYFGKEEAIGKTISVDKKNDYKITGVFEDIPHNSHVKIDILLPWKNLEAIYGEEYYEAWGHTGSYTYLKVLPGTDPVAFEEKLIPLIESEAPWLKEYKMRIDLKMQPLRDIHLTSHFMQELEVNGDRDSVNFLAIIALFIIIMAWVNYVNLSTARSLSRAKEIGLRKVVGATRQKLIVQFFFETIIFNLISILVALGLIFLFLPFFSQITNIPQGVTLFTQNWFWLATIMLFVVGVVLSGSYPVMAISSFKPITVLRGKFGNSAKGTNLRKALIVFQFSMALILIVSTLTVYYQLSFMRNQNLGFAIEQTLVIKAPRVRDDLYNTKFDSFKETLLQRADISNISHVTEVPGRQIYWDNGGIMKAGDDPSNGKNYQIVGVDYDFADFFEIDFIAGRNFSREFPSDKEGLVFNETAVKWMGLENPESSIGQKVDYWGQIYTLIGVVKDYHQQSLKETFEPHIFRFMPYGRGARGMIAIKVNGKDAQETVKAAKQKYDAFFPGNPVDYFFLDDYYNQQYKSDELFGKVFSLFSVLAILITALGIFGLSMFNASQKIKEIGIRKVLGASEFSILFLLTKNFLAMLIISFVITSPILLYGLNIWLENFAIRVSLNIYLFILPLLFTVIITLLTVAFQTIKAAHANPVDSLRNE